MKKPEVGDVLWLHSEVRYIKSGPITITKVGRKWAYYGPVYRSDRFDMGTGYDDGGEYSPSGRVYPSMYEAELEGWMRSTWRKLQGGMGHAPPEGVTQEDLEAAAKLLRVEVPPWS